MSGMFGIHRSVPTSSGTHKSVEWYTPSWVFEELALMFDLDPSSPYNMDSAVPAATKYTIYDDGLKKPWFGRVWLNPPYGPSIGAWMNRMIGHCNGIAMTFSRTDAKWCQKAMQTADAMLFLAGRVEFVPGHENKHKKSRSGAGTVMFAWGSECAEALTRLASKGTLITAATKSK